MPEIRGSFLYELKPYIDKRKWTEASGEISKAIKPSPTTFSDWKKKKDEVDAQVKSISQLKRELEELDRMALKSTGEELRRINSLRGYEYRDGMRVKYGESGLFQKLSVSEEKLRDSQTELSMLQGSMGVSGRLTGAMGKVASGMTKLAGAVTTVIGAIKKVVTTTIELGEKASEMSNRFNAYGSFSDMGTRDLMSRYGINAVQANAMQSALSQMGLSESDFGRMTDAQRKTYDRLIQHFQEGMDSIDITKLEEFYSTMDEFQTSLAEWKMDLQITVLKMLSNSESFKKLMGSVAQFFDMTIEFLENPVVQWFFDLFIDLLDSILTFINNVGGLFGLGGGNSTTNNNTTTSNNNYYIYGSDYASNDELARSIALKQSGSAIG